MLIRVRKIQVGHDTCPAYAGVSPLGVPDVPWHTQILADQLTPFQPDCAHLITTGSPGFSDIPVALKGYASLERIAACSSSRSDP